MIRRKWGRILTVSSMWGQTGGSCEVHYSAAKAGLIGLTKALAREEGPQRHHRQLRGPRGHRHRYDGRLYPGRPSGIGGGDPRWGRLGSPQEVARAPAFPGRGRSRVHHGAGVWGERRSGDMIRRPPLAC